METSQRRGQLAYLSFVGEKETVSYFCAHFEEQLNIYKKQVGFTILEDHVKLLKVLKCCTVQVVLNLTTIKLTMVQSSNSLPKVTYDLSSKLQ